MALDKLSLYGNTFQIKIISALISDRDFLIQIFDILSPEHFESDSNAELIKIVKQYYTDYKELPTFPVFKLHIDKMNNDILKQTMVEQLKEVNKNLGATDLQYVKDEFLDFCKNQKFKSAILDSVDLLKSGDYETIKSKVDEAMKSGTSMDLGHMYNTMDAIKERLIDNPRLNVIPTEWAVLNEIMDGGLGAGDLGVVIGAAGSSKTWFLVSLGYHALLQGKNVLHVTLELNDRYTGMRYDSRLVGIPSNKLKYHIDDVEDSIRDNIKGELIVKYYPTKSASVLTLRSHLEKLKAFNHLPDLLIVDYGDLLRSDNPSLVQSGGSYAESGGIYEDLRGLAGEFDIPCWSASQASRSANNVDVITGEFVAESYKKIMTADFVISVSRKMEDKMTNTARYHIIKNRYGVDGLTFPAEIDVSIGKITMAAPHSVDGEKMNRSMGKSNEMLRSNLAKKYKDFEDES